MVALLRIARHPALATAFLLALAFALPASTAAQKPPLDHGAYDIWKTIRGERISADGAWVLYHLAPRVGDAELVVTRSGDREIRVDRVDSARFSADSRFVIFTIAPAYDSVRTLRLSNTKHADMPADTLGILTLATGEIARVPGVRSWKVPERGAAAVAYTVDRMAAPDTAAADTTEAPAEAPETPGSGTPRPDARTLVLRDLATTSEHRFPDATDFVFSEAGEILAYTSSTDDGTGDGVHVVTTATAFARSVATGEGLYKRLAVSRDGRQIAFLTDRDDIGAEQPQYALFLWRDGREAARRVAAQGVAGIPAGWQVSEDGSLRFSENGRRLFFGTAPRPTPAPSADSLLPDERVRLDVWHWRDGHIQPMQLVNAERERTRTYEAVVHLGRGDRVVQLATEAMPTVQTGDRGNADFAMAETDVPYRQLVGFETPGFSDLWLIDVRDGQRRKVVENRQVGMAGLSPGGRYLAWYDFADRHWQAIETARDRRVVLTADIPFPVWSEDHDLPMLPGPYGRAGWTEGDLDLLVYDRFDIWAVDPAGRDAPRPITNGLGREWDIQLRHIDLDPTAPAISREEPMLLSGFHVRTKDAGFFRADIMGGHALQELVWGPKSYGRPVRAQGGDALLYTRQDVVEFPDLWTAGPWLEGATRVSHANPHQADYNWASAELVEWHSTDGTPLQGILYRPEDFDPSRAYPLIVYFYERSSDGLHQHIPPLPHRSVIRPTFYASRGYLVFVPDIVYQQGYPGKSAMDAVMPGVLRLAAEPWVDESNVGIQGHSWGGYQIAYMITRTNFFKAAGAGAPVANMTSAYGGIRHETGLSRVFQYERTQSRIGGSLWEQTPRYIENSPLFFLDRVRTPLLIMHNDGDGHVPFQQGVELFIGLRRLGKPTWLINYNDQPHWPVTAANIRDWNIRLQQYFDHFLKGAPAPAWMVDGIPALEKGRTLGLDPVEGA
jgi:dipeptidyl aminopeptidase/acylaminoacyl peptidase